MPVQIGTVDFDLNGYAVINPIRPINYSNVQRRFNKVKTLDGGVAVSDGGFSHGDKNVTVTFQPTESLDATLKNIVEYHARVNVGLRDGCYQAVLTYTPGSDSGKVTLSIISKISE